MFLFVSSSGSYVCSLPCVVVTDSAYHSPSVHVSPDVCYTMLFFIVVVCSSCYDFPSSQYHSCPQHLHLLLYVLICCCFIVALFSEFAFSTSSSL